jgi:hypothetical protein
MNLRALPDPDMEYLLSDSHVLPAGILIASVDGRRLGDAHLLGLAFCLLLLLAIQLEIWPIEIPVSCFRSSFSSSVGYGWSACCSSQSFNTFVVLRGKRAAAAPFLARSSPVLSSWIGPMWPSDLICFLPVSPPKHRSSSSPTTSNVSKAVLCLRAGVLSEAMKLHGRNKALHGEHLTSPEPSES